MRDDLLDLQGRIAALRSEGDDYVIIAVGARGPNMDMPEGNVLATVRMGDDEGTAEAKYLQDAISLARVKIINERAARAKAEERKREKAA